ncbi:MAG: hypothetical protein IT452_16135 [Planctomycetia bacterium]|nr:hypothetical protein [Planctomycetia bacterium]
MIGAAILRGDLARLSKRGRTWAARFAFVGVFFVASSFEGPWAGDRVDPETGARMMAVFLWCELFGAAVLAPAFMARAIASEREGGTLDLLAACPHSNADLVFGRGASHAVWAMALLLSGTPFAVAATTVGGVPVVRAVTASVHIGLLAVFTMAVALRVSLHAPTASRAVSDAFLWILSVAGMGFSTAWVSLGILAHRDRSLVYLVAFYGVGVVLAGVALRAGSRVIGAIGAFLIGIAGLMGYAVANIRFWSGSTAHPVAMDRVVAFLCPTAVSFTDLFDRPLDGTTRAIGWCSQALYAAVFLALIARSLRRNGLELPAAPAPPPAGPPLNVAPRPAPPRPPSPPASPSRVHILESAPSPSSLLHGDLPPRPVPPPPPASPAVAAPRRSRSLPVWNNPILWMDVRIARNPVSGCFIGLAVALFGLLTLLTLMASSSLFRSREAHLPLVVDLAALAMILAPATATAVSRERTSGNLPILAATGFPVSSILAGKILATAWHLRALLALTFLRILLLAIDSVQASFAVLALFAVALGSLACISTAAATIVPGARAGAAAAFAAGFALWATAPLLMAFDVLPSAPVWSSPITLVVAVIEKTGGTRPGVPTLLPWLLVHFLAGTVAFIAAAASFQRSARA